MARVLRICLFVISTIRLVIRCHPINNGFSIKFSPLFLKEEIKPKEFGALFAKISQDLTPESDFRRKILTKALFPQATDLGSGCTNQVARLILPTKGSYDYNDIQTWDPRNYINLPIVNQPYEDYKILVATAPTNMKLNEAGDEQPIVIYIVFPDDSTDVNSLSVPTIYFVNESSGKYNNLDKKEKYDPILIIDNNRTVSGLKSKEIPKFIKFKNRLNSGFEYYDFNNN